MIDHEYLVKRIAKFYLDNSVCREKMIVYLYSKGMKDLNSDSDARMAIMLTARAAIPFVLARATSQLRAQYACSPTSLSILFGPDDQNTGQSHADRIASASKRKIQQHQWIEVQVAAHLERMTADEINLMDGTDIPC